MTYYRIESNTVILRLYVQPGAKKTEIIGLVGDALKIKLAALPIEGKANIALLNYLSKLFKVPKSQIRLKSGENARHKTFEIKGCTTLPESLLQS